VVRSIAAQIAPGKQAVGVEVPNASPNLVTLGDVFDDLPHAASPLSVWLGKDISGTAVWATCRISRTFAALPPASSDESFDHSVPSPRKTTRLRACVLAPKPLSTRSDRIVPDAMLCPL
jgi:hypothetical protein